MEIVKPENLEFRDGDLSLRHRLWGFDCPAVDLDFVVVEYNRSEASAIVEYKYALKDAEPDLSHPSMKALAGLADAAGIPLIVACYTRQPWTFRVYRGNRYAEQVYREDGRLLTEREFVESLYFIRGRNLADADAGHLAGLDQVAA